MSLSSPRRLPMMEDAPDPDDAAPDDAAPDDAAPDDAAPDDAAPDDCVPGWYAVASSRELSPQKPLALERFGTRLVVFRHADGIAVLSDHCPHRGVALSGGEVRDGRLICPFHGFEFDAAGVCQHIPAHGPDGHIPKAMRATQFEAREEHGFIFVWWGNAPDTLPAIDWFHEELDGTFGPNEIWRDTTVGLSRNIENQLDMIHLPFVHRRTIGRFVKDPAVEVETVVHGNRVRAFRPGNEGTYIELRMPNLWINHIGNGQFIVLAFVPLSRHRTRLYTRFYQNQITWPVFRTLYGWVMKQANKWILEEDIRVIETHRPRVSPPLDGSEVLIPADGPSIAYRKLRAKLTEEPQRRSASLEVGE